MHQALHIQEILFDIFGHCSPTEPHWTPLRRHSTAVLAALARTCRTFKEPALDVLWSELVDLTPLPQCVPDACQVVGRRYSFRRPLDEAEWTILRSYTCRIWHILGYANPHGWLDNDSLIRICSAAVVDPLFPNLRTFHWQGITMIPAMHIAVPSLTALILILTYGHVPALKDFLDTVGDLCPNINRVQIRISPPHDLCETICSHIRRLTNLQVLDSRGVTFDTDMILYLSERPALKRLSFTLDRISPDRVPLSCSVPVFSALGCLETSSRSLEQVMDLLSIIRLPVVEDLNADFTAYPLEETFRSYVTTVRNTCPSDALAGLRIRGIGRPRTPLILSTHRLTLDGVRPCMGFVNLRSIHINLPRWHIDLTDSDLLALVSTWPRIRTLLLNDQWGWRTTSGITLRGLSRLLQIRPSLSYLCIAIDTESHADLLHEFETGSTGFPLPSVPLMINLADSRIRKTEDVPGLVDAIWKLGLNTSSFLAWEGIDMEVEEGDPVHQKHEWSRVFAEVIKGPPSPAGEQDLAPIVESG